MDSSNKDNSSPKKGFENEAQRAPRPKSSKLTRPSNRDRGNTRVGSPPQEESVHSVRQSFQTALNKISQQETREIALKEIQGIISANNSPPHLRIYFSSLRDQKRQCDSATKEIEILIFGYIASVFKKNLLDPLDKPPELLKSVVRLCEYIHSYFKDTSQGVQIACGKSLKEIYSSCIEDESAEIVSLIMIEPLYSILNGGADRATQHTAAHCFNEILKLFQLKNKTDLLETAASRLYTIFLKTNHDFPELLESIAVVIFKISIKGLQGKYTAFVGKLCDIIESKVVINQYYLTKIEACGVLLAFAYALRGAEVEQKVIDSLSDKATPVLKDASKNKIFKVQQAASEALKFWTVLKGGPEAENIKLELPKIAQQVEADKPRVENAKNEGAGSHNFKEIRSRLKQAKFEDNTKQNEAGRRGVSVGAQESGIDLQNVKYGSQNRGQKFTKSRSGTGGGHIGWGSPENADGKKSAHEKQKKSIKDIIAQKGEGKIRPQSVGPKTGDRFLLVEKELRKKKSESRNQDEEEEQQEERSRTPPRRKAPSNNEIIEEEQQEQQDLQEDAQEQIGEDDVSQRGRSRQSEKRPSQSSQKENLSSHASEGNEASELPEDHAPAQFVEKIQKVTMASQMKSDAGVGQKTKPATTTTTSKTTAPSKTAPTKNVVQEEVRTNVRKPEPRNNDIMALEGKLASVIGKSREEVSAEIDQRVEDNRQKKTTTQVQVPKAQPQQTKVQVPQTQSTKKKVQQPRYKLADEDAYLFKSIEFMDNTDFQTEPNYIDEYDAEAGNQLTFGQGSSSQGGNVFTEKIQRSSNPLMTNAGVSKTKPAPAQKSAATTTATTKNQPQPQAQTTTKKQPLPKKNAGGMFGFEGNMANVVAGFNEEIVPEFVEKVEVNRSAKTIPKVPPKAASKQKGQTSYKLGDEDASLFKSIEFMDNLDVPSDFNGIEEYMLDPNQYVNQPTANENEEETNYRSQTQPNKAKARRNERSNAGNVGPLSQPSGPVVIEGEIGEDGAIMIEGKDREEEKGQGEGEDEDEGEREREREREDEDEDKGEGEGEGEGENAENEENEGGIFVEEEVGEGDEGFIGNMMKKVGLGGKDDKPAEKKKEEPKKEQEAGKEKKGIFQKIGDKISDTFGFGDKEEKEKEAEKGKNESPAKGKEGEHKEEKEVKSPEVKPAKQESPEKPAEAKETKKEVPEKESPKKEPVAQKTEEKKATEPPKVEKVETKPAPEAQEEKAVKDMDEDAMKSKLGGKLKDGEEESPQKKKGWMGQTSDWLKNTFSGEKDKKDRSKTPEKAKEQNDTVRAEQEDEKAKKGSRSSSPIKDAGNWVSNKLGFGGKKDNTDKEEQKAQEDTQTKKNRSSSPIKDAGNWLGSKLGFSGKKEDPKKVAEAQKEIPNVSGVDDDDEVDNPVSEVKQLGKTKNQPNVPAKQVEKSKIEGRKEPNVAEVPGKSLEQKILDEIGMNMGAYFGKLGGQSNESQVAQESIESGNISLGKTPGPNKQVRAPQTDDRAIKRVDYNKVMDEYEDNYRESPIETTPIKEMTKASNIQDSAVRTSEESMERQIMEEIGKSMSFYLNHQRELNKSQTSPESQPKPAGKQEQQGEKFKKVAIERNEEGLPSIKERTLEEDPTEKDQLKDSLMWTKKGREVFEQRIGEEIRRGMGQPEKQPVVQEMKKGGEVPTKESYAWNQRGHEIYDQYIAEEIKRGLAEAEKQRIAAEQAKKGGEVPTKESYAWNQKGREAYEQYIAEEIRRGMGQPEKQPVVQEVKKGGETPNKESYAWNQKGHEMYDQYIAEEIKRGLAEAEKQRIAAEQAKKGGDIPTKESYAWNQKGREVYEQYIAEEIRKGMGQPEKQRVVEEAPTKESMAWNQRGREIFEQRTAEQMRRMEHPDQGSLAWNQKGREAYEKHIAAEVQKGLDASTKDSMAWNQRGREIFEQRTAEQMRRMEHPDKESMAWSQKGREVFESRIAEQVRSGMGGVQPDRFSTLGKSESNIQKTSGLEDTQLGDEILEELDRQYQGEEDFQYQHQHQSRGRYYDPEGDFVDSTMDEKTLEAYLQNEQNAKYVNKNPSKLLKQFTFDPQAKRSVPETPNFMSSKGIGNLEDTMVFASTEGFPSQVKISTRPDERERDYMGETIVSIEGDNVSSSFKPGKTFPPRKLQESKAENTSAGEMWNKAMEDLAQQNYESAYNRILSSGDDIYLLRMLKLTGPCLKKLNRATAMKLLKRVIALQKSKFFEKMALGFFENAHRTQVTHNMKIEEQNLLLKALYNMSGRSDLVGQTAASLHESVNVDLRTI